jgi:hypothetical protein
VCRPALERLETRLLLASTPETAAQGPAAVVPVSIGGADVQGFVHRGLLAWATAQGVISISHDSSPVTAKVIGDATSGEYGTPAPTPPPLPPPPAAAPDPDHETPAALEGAQDVPSMPVFRYDGSMSENHPEVFFRIPIDPTTRTIDVQVESADPSKVCPDWVWVYGPSGTELYKGPQSATASISVKVVTTDGVRYTAEINDQNVGEIREFFVRIAPAPGYPLSALPGASGTATPNAPITISPQTGTGTVVTPETTAFVLLVRRESTASLGPSLVTSTGLDSSLPTGLASSAGQGFIARASSVGLREDTGTGAGSGLPDTVTTLSPVPVPVKVATGPLPSLSAAPLAGALGIENEPTPVVSATDTVVVDLALHDLPQGGWDALAVDADPALAASDGERGLIAFRGPGGFPLFGAPLLAETRSENVEDHGDFRAFAPAPAGATVPIETLALAADAFPMGGNELDDGRGRGVVRRVSAFAGLSVVLAFVTGLALPDLTDPNRAKAASRPRFRLRIRLRGHGRGSRSPRYR